MLFGKVSPSGKLAQTIPFDINDDPSTINVLVFGCDGFEQCDLLGRHVEGLTVEAFGFGRFREPQEHEHHVGALGSFDGFGFECWIGRSEVEGESWGELGIHAAFGEGVKEAGQEHLER